MLDALQMFAPDELLQVSNSGWSIQDILAHVANAEILNVKFARLMLETDKPIQVREVAAEFPDFTGPFELDRFNAYMTKKLRAQSLAQVLETLNQTRAATMAWLDLVTPEQLERTGQHAAWSEQTLRGMLKILIIHDKAHTQEIVKRARPRV